LKVETPAIINRADHFVLHEQATVQIKWNRVLLGSLVWFVVYNVLTGAAWYSFLQSKSLAPFHPLLGRPFPQRTASVAVFFLALTLILGIFAVWFYAAIRPRYGPGPRTAACAGFALWLIIGLLPTLTSGGVFSFPPRLLFMEMVAKLVMIVLATLAGAWTYQE
jgi:hypothetical protein